LGDIAQCKEWIKQYYSFFNLENRLRLKWISLYRLAEVYLILGEFDSAKTSCQESLDWFLINAEEPEESVHVAEARLIMRKILVDLGVYQDALDYLDKAKTAFEMCQHYPLGETLLYLGKAYQGLGGAVFLRQAKEYVTQALAEFQRLKLHHKEREAQEVLKTL
jgi:tetratricopeptide (TPR) repeat protein